MYAWITRRLGKRSDLGPNDAQVGAAADRPHIQYTVEVEGDETDCLDRPLKFREQVVDCVGIDPARMRHGDILNDRTASFT